METRADSTTMVLMGEGFTWINMSGQEGECEQPPFPFTFVTGSLYSCLLFQSQPWKWSNIFHQVFSAVGIHKCCITAIYWKALGRPCICEFCVTHTARQNSLERIHMNRLRFTNMFPFKNAKLIYKWWSTTCKLEAQDICIKYCKWCRAIILH